MVHLGFLNEVVRSPAIWLCLECKRCTDACTQRVDGDKIIQTIRNLAIHNNIVDSNILSRIKDANRNIYSRFLEKVDLELELNR